MNSIKSIYKNNTIFYLLTAAIFLSLKFAYTFLDNESLRFLLAPTSACVSWATGSDSVFQRENGYYYADLNVLIEKSCSGFTFCLLCFLVLIIAWLEALKNAFSKFLLLFISLIISYLFTIIVNTSRILIAIKIEKLLPHSNQKYSWLHEAEGVLVYLSFLIGLYVMSLFLLKKIG